MNEATKNCMLCSAMTIELKRFDPMKNSRDYQGTRRGLTCIKCGKFICEHCIAKLTPQLKLKKKYIRLDCIDLVSNIIEYDSDNKNNLDYVGHCCLFDYHIAGRASDISTKRKKRFNDACNSDNIKSYGGSFVIPEYHLMIANTTTAMDVFALGKDKELAPVIHYVLDEENANELASSGIFPCVKVPQSWQHFKRVITITLPHSIFDEETTVSLLICKLYSVLPLLSHVITIC